MNFISNSVSNFFSIVLFSVIKVLANVIIIVGASQADETKPLRVGIIAPLSGELAVFGTKILQGIELAKERLADKQVEFYIEDAGEVSRSTVVNSVQKLLSVNHVDLVIAVVFEDHLFKIFPLLQRNNIPVIGAGLCSEVTLSFPNAACSYPSAYDQLVPLFPYAHAKNLKTFSFIGEESAFATGTLKAFSQQSKNGGFSLVSTELLSSTSLDFHSIITKSLANKPDAVIAVTTDPAKSLALLRQLKEQGYKGVRFAFIDYDKKYYADFGEAIRGVVIPGWISSRFNSDFMKRYSKRWPTKISEVDVYATLSYDMLSFATLSALDLRSRGIPLTIHEMIKFKYQNSAIPDFHYNSDRSVSLPIVVKAIGKDGELTEELP